MATISKSITLNHSAKRVFNLICDVENYSNFISGCSESLVLYSGDGYLKGKLVLVKSGVSISLTTINKMTPFSKVTMNIIDGPFSKFVGEWNLTQLAENKCRVSFNLDYATDNIMIKLAAKSILQSVTEQLLTAFEKELKK